MAGNVVSSCATYWTLTYLEEENALEKAARAAESLTAGLNDLFASRGFPFFAYHYASIVHFETAAPLAVDIREPGGVENALARKAAVDDLALALLDQGIVTKYGNRAFTCMAHSDDDIRRTLAAFDTVLEMISVS
jgi:glutamate-1-semialdehyde aminotransferase